MKIQEQSNQALKQLNASGSIEFSQLSHLANICLSDALIKASYEKKTIHYKNLLTYSPKVFMSKSVNTDENDSLVSKDTTSISSKSDSILDDLNSQDSSKNEKVSEEESVISDISCETSSSEESSKVSEKELNEIIKQGWVDWFWGIDPNLSNKKRKLK